MSTSDDYYKVKILIGADGIDPEFLFSPDEKEKMLSFIDVCIENGHEITLVKDDLKDA